MCILAKFYTITRMSLIICKTRYVHSSMNRISDLDDIKSRHSKAETLYSRHLGLYEKYVAGLLQLYERHCPGFCAMLALDHKRQDLRRPSTGIWWENPLVLAPIVHPQRWDLDDFELTEIYMPESGFHPLLSSILAPRVPEIYLRTALSCLRYLQAGGHSVKSRKSLKPLLKSRYFTRLKMRPSLSRFRNRRHRHSSRRCLLDEQDLHSMWWGDRPEHPSDRYIQVIHNSGRDYKHGIRVPLHFFSYRSEYASNYDLWYTYRCALQLLPLFLAKSPPDFHFASIATNCIFSTFCTTYSQETRKAKKSIARYLCRCRPIEAIPLRGSISVDVMNGMDVD